MPAWVPQEVEYIPADRFNTTKKGVTERIYVDTFVGTTFTSQPGLTLSNSDRTALFTGGTSAVKTGTIVSTLLRDQLGIAPSSYAVEFTVDTLSGTGRFAIPDGFFGQTYGYNHDGSFTQIGNPPTGPTPTPAANPPWVAGDKIGIVVYRSTDDVVYGGSVVGANVAEGFAVFHNGTFIADKNALQIDALTVTGSGGMQLTMQPDVTQMAYAATYEAWHHHAGDPNAASWPYPLLGITITPPTQSVAAGATATLTVSIAPTPSSPVNVTLSTGASGVTITPSTLTFGPTTTSGTVTVSCASGVTATIVSANDGGQIDGSAVVTFTSVDTPGYGATHIDPVSGTPGVAGSAGSQQLYYADLGGSGHGHIDFYAEPTTGSVQFYIRAHVPPTTTTYDYTSGPIAAGSFGGQSLPAVEGTVYYMLLVGLTDFSDCTLYGIPDS